MTFPMPTQTLPPTRTWSAVLFDLDGTIIDSASDITNSLAHTFSTLGLPVPSEDDLLAFVGPPLLDSFRMIPEFSEQDAWRALEIYRAHYEPRAMRSPVFPGMAGVLERVQAAGLPIALATSKPESMARAVLEHAGLTKHFTVISGASDDEELSTKAEVVREALRGLREQGADTSEAVMVGDREYDTLGAAAHGVPTIMVEWGYGSPAEAGDTYAVVHSTDQLRQLLIG